MEKAAEAAPQPTADKPAEVKKSENGGEQK